MNTWQNLLFALSARHSTMDQTVIFQIAGNALWREIYICQQSIFQMKTEHKTSLQETEPGNGDILQFNCVCQRSDTRWGARVSCSCRQSWHHQHPDCAAKIQGRPQQCQEEFLQANRAVLPFQILGWLGARVAGSSEHPDQHSRTCPHSILPLSPFLQAFLIFSSRKQHSVLSGAAHVSHTRVIFSFSPRKEQIMPSLMQLKKKKYE